MLRVVRKIIFSLLILFGVLLVSGVVVTHFYKDELIAQVVTEINKSLNTPVHVSKIDMSVWHHFPRVSFRFHDIDIRDSYPGNDSSLVRAGILDLSFNPLQAAFGDLVVDKVYLKDARVALRMNTKGEINYRIFKEEQDSSRQAQPVKIRLAAVQLDQVQFIYENAYRNINLDLFTPGMDASVVAEGVAYDILADGEVEVNNIETGGKSYHWDFPVSVQSSLAYNDSLKDVEIRPSTLSMLESDFEVSGRYQFLDKSAVSLKASSEATNVQTLLALLRTGDRFDKYTSTGDVYLTLNLEGEWKENSAPALEVAFGLRDADILHKPSGIRLQGAFLTGIFAASDIGKSGTYLLNLQNIRGYLDNDTFEGNLSWKNPENPWVDCNFRGTLNLDKWLAFMPVEGVRSGRGLARADISFKGLLGNLKQKRGLSRIETSGEFSLNDVYMEFSGLSTGLRNVNGNLLFNNNDLELRDVSGYFGRSDFLLNGYFKNVIAYLLFDEEPVGIESSLRSRRIDMDELLSLSRSQDDKDEPYSFTISSRLRLNFDCEIDRLDFRRFHPTGIKGDLKVKNKVAFTDRLELSGLGGDLAIYGMVDASKNGLVRISTHFDLDDILVDSIFYVFENFNQDFLVDDHLEGAIDASVDAEMVFSDRLRLYPETLSAHSTFSIRNGELNNFEPMQRLSRYLDERKLEQLRFSELRNEVVIKDRTIFLPQMEVGSNVTDIRISGTHTFDQRITYNVVAPLRSKPKYDSDRAFGAIREDSQGRSMLYLKILGTTSDYEVLYDQERVKEKIAADIKKEATELKEIFRNKGRQAETPVLTEDDYFEWDDEDGDQ